jgi:plasma kallikrein
VNGTINTDGSDLLDIRFGEGEECVDYFEQCCATGDVLPSPPPPTQPVVIQSTCGFRNAEGVGFRITGNSDGESEYGRQDSNFPYFQPIDNLLLFYF